MGNMYTCRTISGVSRRNFAVGGKARGGSGEVHHFCESNRWTLSLGNVGAVVSSKSQSSKVDERSRGGPLPLQRISVVSLWPGCCHLQTHSQRGSLANHGGWVAGSIPGVGRLVRSLPRTVWGVVSESHNFGFLELTSRPAQHLPPPRLQRPLPASGSQACR